MNDQIRLSDAERETASQALGEHYAQGRLDADEHAERHERIWSARTRSARSRRSSPTCPAARRCTRP